MLNSESGSICATELLIHAYFNKRVLVLDDGYLNEMYCRKIARRGIDRRLSNE